MNIGLAIEALKNGECVRRSGWNGKGQFVYLGTLFRYFDGVKTEFPKCFILKTAQDSHQPGWVASTSDLLAEDWEIMPTATTQ